MRAGELARERSSRAHSPDHTPCGGLPLHFSGLPHCCPIACSPKCVEHLASFGASRRQMRNVTKELLSTGEIAVADKVPA